MKSRRQITRSDVVVFSIAALLLLTNLAAIGTAGRERAKRAVCLSNLKQLTTAWRQFANDHDGRLVNGMAGMARVSGSVVQEGWVGACWPSNYLADEQLPEAIQREGIKSGALWPYIEELNLYRCPSGHPGAMVTYAIVDAMNGLSRSGTASGGKSVRIGETTLWVRNLDEIVTPGPGERMAFIDTGRPIPGSFSCHYEREAWWDDPPVRHDENTTVSFADGHAKYWQWKGAETVAYGRRNDETHWGGDRAPETAEGQEDLHRLQRAVWGRLGYEPMEP